ncbi:hypothetical protein OAK43_03095, partial [Verrucomicrobiales bacterium]|nr:hypothetical protein [Verrucomicrobiales bacterium]
PIRAECWDAKHPGWLEADTVAHCGGDMGGSFIWSLTATDIFSGWTEVRPSWNRGQHNVCEAFKKIEADLPSRLKTENLDQLIGVCFFKDFYRRIGPAGIEGVQ